jgi:hypothetical protein
MYYINTIVFEMNGQQQLNEVKMCEITIEDICCHRKVHLDSYLNVTSRYNIAAVKYPNFYDLVPVSYQEKGKHNSNEIMQLSSRGVLLNLDGGTQLIPLQIFLNEKLQLESLHNLLFFKRFKECRCFVAWRSLVRKSRVIRGRKALAESAVYSNIPFVSASIFIGNAMYKLGEYLPILRM